MYQSTFEALAVATTLTSRQEINNEDWQKIGIFFIENYIKQLGKTEKSTIGHVKGLIELKDDNFIKLSCVSQNHPVNSEMVNSEGVSNEGHLIFNAIVAGITKTKNIQYFQMALVRTCSVYDLITDYHEATHGNLDEGEKTCPVCHEHHHHGNSCAHHH
ncbi:hypothetical protein [Acetobacterium woodii]|uniref:Uncharacterized protein n=1 Tax=Acetobacterium woodii (strain ATCC 29683 / DSM 1030 / JCM 2381 / KCTC 1655 / WB1) TaxID=931626 RepID=H6LIN1_ACEWD|nr:hypothetical protein [Acetobacterium woodii]AFA48605.1 hypothetical protein Awo_c18250 [Acetobacterium woodii DSM 1030]